MTGQRSAEDRMRFFVEQVQERGRFELIDDLFHPDFRNRTAAPGQRDDRAAVRELMTALHEAFSDLRVEILHCVADGDLVATHKVFRGRHTGSWFGVPPSDRQVEFRVMDILRHQDGQWVEHWAVADGVSLLRQTGALP
ncbi:putative ester cyclase [Kitasatospora sp. GAS204A]|uniref:ester cyclase n=1 Tax=unclassified Kitasatospora TaxID=2633591 RepID=UPI0024750512|nr:ester cyclase [Kitasatospora sp. GAS204B]MDH6120129.1 putative ester cyclase [Kitasatospora sp. GAS204B]